MDMYSYIYTPQQVAIWLIQFTNKLDYVSKNWTKKDHLIYKLYLAVLISKPACLEF